MKNKLIFNQFTIGTAGLITVTVSHTTDGVVGDTVLEHYSPWTFEQKAAIVQYMFRHPAEGRVD